MKISMSLVGNLLAGVICIATIGPSHAYAQAVRSSTEPARRSLIPAGTGSSPDLAEADAVAGSGATFLLSLEPIVDSIGPAGSTIRVEAFLTNISGADFLIWGYQIDLPCVIQAQPGGAGEMFAQPTPPCQTSEDCPLGAVCELRSPPIPNLCTSTFVDDFSHAASGSVPWVFLEDGLKPVALLACRGAGAPGPGQDPVLFPTGARRYAGTTRYRVSDCASGTFVIIPESMTDPCTNLNLTRIIDSQYQCEPFILSTATITVPSGQCCVGDVCVEDSIGPICCYDNHPGASWTPNRTCADACGCASDAECDDDVTCSGVERCQDGQCVPGTPPTCPPSTAPCFDRICDQGADLCLGLRKPTGTPCDTGNDCEIGATCTFFGACHGTLLPAGSPCEDGNACTQSDACDSAGQCYAGPTITCGDIFYCNGVETCDPAVGCISGTSPCGPLENCDEETDSCSPAVIPTTTTWGLVVLTITFLIAGKTRFGRAVIWPPDGRRRFKERR